MTGLLLDHLWQSTLFTLAAACLALALRRHGAQVRYWVWFAAAGKFLIPFALIAASAGWLAAQLHAQAPAPPRLELARQVFAPMTAQASLPAIRSVQPTPVDLGAWIALAWALGCLAVLWWRFAQGRPLRQALAEASPVAVPAALPAVAARTRGGPAIVGVLKPVLVLPQGLTERLTPAELEAVLEHEQCHARRLDNLLVLPLVLVQALFWFHPAVWWIGRRLLAERERACDEAVLQGGIDPETYARGLLEACRLELEPVPVLAAAATGGAGLKRRIRRIMSDHPPRPLGASGGLALWTATGAALALPVLAGVYSATPSATRVPDLARPLAVALPRTVSAALRAEPAPQPGSPTAADVTLVSVPAALTQAAVYAPAAEHPIRLARRVAVPAFEPAPPEPAAASAVQAADGLPPAADPEILRALAERTAYVAGADPGGARLALRSAAACPTAGVAEAERRLGGEAVSTAFDGRVGRFVGDALAGKPGRLSPAMAAAMDKALPALRPVLAARFAGPSAAHLIGEDRSGRDVYLVRSGGAGYALVLVDDLGQIDAALFCTEG